MKLKKIEIQGFKSFADKMAITFKDGITAVVGPNGSGKSNISDAIRWVLGEQSVKTLRGSKMEDIIFAGTSKRKPLGYTEVTISFDNKSGSIPIDYEEVAVTRRMFRSGESEYYINKNSCRLKDVRELFMDTGVGKDGYSIVGQGRIEEILSNRPEDRRSIFEEAAGIVRYKTKKEEAERKLEKTEDNLLRIKDIVYELTSQSDVLELQAQKASEFSKLFNILKELEVNIFIRDIKNANDNIEAINKEIKTLEENLDSKMIEKNSIEEKFNFLKENSERLDLEIEEYRKKEMSSINELETNKNKITLLEEKKGFYNRDLIRIENEKLQLRERLEKLKEENNLNEEEKNKLIDEYDHLLTEYNSKAIDLESKLLNLKEKEDHIEYKKDNIIKIYNKGSDKKSELNSISAFNDNIQKRTSQLDKEIQSMILEKESISEKYKELSLLEFKLIDERDMAKEKLTSFKEIEKNTINDEEILIKEINSINIDLQGKRSSLKLFQNMDQGYEGYYKGVKSVLQAAKTDSNIEKGLVGVVAELIKVDEKFVKAIDVALGSNSQNIVTHTENDAKEIIEYLKKNRLGRITCLPLKAIKGTTLNLSSEEREEFKILGLASELVDYDEKHNNIFESLLGRTIIIENMDYGIKLANKYKHRYRIVTLDGEVLNPGGSMTGGSFASNSVSIISRRNQIEKLESEVKDLEKLQKKLLEDKNKIINRLIEDKKEVTVIEDLIKDLEYKVIKSTNNKENQKLESFRIQDSISKAEKEIETLNLEVDNYKMKKDRLNKEIIELEQESIDLKESIKKLTIIFNKEKVDREEMNSYVTEMKINLNKKASEIDTIKGKIEKNIGDIENINLELKEKEESYLINQEEITKFENSSIELNELIKELENIKLKTTEDLETLTNKKRKLMESFYFEQEKLRLVNDKIGSMEKTKNSQEVKLARLSVQLETYHKKLQDDYELLYEEALKFEREVQNVQEAIAETRKLKVKIKELGTVNLSSIEEYKNLKARLEFILGQESDLNKAKTDLREVILDMENKMKKQFLLSFEEINENFQEIFKILFDGGKAELFLADEEDILNTGIEIKAQPPGKKLQNLSLLSGGEKSLTAVALLFSILKMKPAPFCVLDEIDAALDEANIGRYTNYLKTYCNDTQFIMITHRKTTMEMADVLYGVTMEEEGISKLISIELTDNLDEIAS